MAVVAWGLAIPAISVVLDEVLDLMVQFNGKVCGVLEVVMRCLGEPRRPVTGLRESWNLGFEREL